MDEIISSTLVAQKDGLSSALGWFDITEEDSARVSKLSPFVDEIVDDVIASFYARAGGYDHPTRDTENAAQMSSIREEQKRHFRELVDAGLDAEYFSNRKVSGVFNERSGISPSFYMGIYTYFISQLSDLILARAEDKDAAHETISSLHKIASCHQALTLDAFSAAREEAIEVRERQMSELPTPVLRLQQGLLLVPVVGTLDSHRARLLTVQMLEAIRDQEARAVVLDITGVAAVDSAVANHLMQTMTAARLMGAQSVLTGITADVAQALVKVGVTGDALNPAGDLERGVQTARQILDI